ncbi:gephyrin-like molybdotransferase Glp [Ciceribacter azotifigens]|uniref:molybdopterin molybdotransferase MoeA n=1 Tax=Ciceribacter azotifigens TaxID=2069303 RepID=UPI003A86D340
MALLSVSEARSRLLDPAVPISRTEVLDLHHAAGRVLAEDLVARLTQPPFDASAMDGYALRSRDAAAPGAILRVIGTASAGHGFYGTIGEGEAVRIFTGAPVPAGADAVLIQEDTEKLEDGRVRTTFAVTAGRHVRPRGQDFAEGETVLTAGQSLDFPRLTLAAALNHREVVVYRKPLVAILATGDELVRPGENPGPDQIVGSNSFGVAALARENGADVLDLGIVPDDTAQITAAVGKAQEAGADVLVTLGGASVGDHDLVQKTLVDAGMQLDFWKIAMRPGKPLMVGRLGQMHVLGLPGNPVSSMVCGLLFLEPLVCKLARRAPRNRDAVAKTANALRANDRRQDHLRARLTRDDEGRLVAEPYEKQDSSMMKIFANSDCLIIRPPHAPELAPGSPCSVLLLRPLEE